MKLIANLVAIAVALAPPFVSAQSTEFINLNVVQNDSGNTTSSVTVTKAAGSSPNMNVRTGSNRGDYSIDMGYANDFTTGVVISSISQNGRNNNANGDTIGVFYATPGADVDSTASPNRFFLPLHNASSANEEVNVNMAAGHFPYTLWLGGIARNSTNSNGGVTNTLTASTGINLGTQFTTAGSGVFGLNLTSINAAYTSRNGVLLVNHFKNEDNYALSTANANGSFSMIVKDNYSDAAATEQDPIAFVYLPKADVGTKRLVALGRVNGDASTDVSGGTFTVTKSGAGQWYLSIPGHSNTTGVLLISPENGGTNTRDNIVSYQWDSANSRWVIESRDINGTGLPTLQDVGGAEDVFSFAFFGAPVVPVVAMTSPAAGSTATANASFTLEATATDADGTIANVQFLRNGTVIATDTTAPYSYADSGLAAGPYFYQARATDNEGNATTTGTTQVIVNLATPLPANTALGFDGVNDYVTMGAAPQLNVGGPAPITGFTLECWFRREGAGLTTDSGSGGVTGAPLFGKGRGEADGSNIDCNIFFGVTTGGILVADFESFATGLNHPVTGTNTPITNGTWNHAAVSFDGATGVWKLYLNGTEVGTATVSVAGAVPRYDSIQHFGIGTAMNSTGVAAGFFQGAIDEARVWNYVRSAAEITAAKDLEIAGGTGLVARYGLNEGTGTTTSSSTNVPSGTLMNGSVWVNGAPLTSNNAAPAVTLTAPANGASSYMPFPVELTADASDADGTVSKVEFYVNGTEVAEDTTAPYSYSWTPPAVGTYAVYARVQDNTGAFASSSQATITIDVNPDQAPTVSITSPTNGATVTGNSVSLQAGVSDPEGSAMNVTFYGRATTPATPGPDFTLVAIPDTQYYSEGSASRANTVTVEQLIGTFGAQTQWVLDNKTSRNIAFVSHMGDIVEKGHNGGNPIEWERASAAMGRLENPVAALRAHGVPFGLAPGNHDIEPIGAYDTGSTAFFNQFFPVSRFTGRDYWGGNYGSDNSNNYQLFSISGLDFLTIHFAYDTTPNQAILDWADALMKQYPHRRVIVTSHYIIGYGNPGSFGSQGLAMYNAFKDNPNFFLMLCGHIHAEGRRSDTFEGRVVYTILSDYQGLPNGGQGLLRTFTFSPTNNRIRVESWSPTLNRAATAADGLPHLDGTYDLTYNMQTPISGWAALGTVSVPAGGTTASLTWNGLETGKAYEWYAAVSDGVNAVGTSASRFSTAGGTAPQITLDSPANGATFSSPALVSLSATASDGLGIARVEFYQGGTKLGDDTSAPYTADWTGVQPGTYVLSAIAVNTAGLSTLSNSTTIIVNPGDLPPTVTLTAPATGSAYEAPAGFTLAADATDPEGAATKVEFYRGTINPVLLGEDTTAPYTFEVAGLGAGSHSFTARATDAVNQTATSAAISVTVTTEASSPDNATLSAGNFDVPSWTVIQTTAAPRQFNLPGTDAGDLELRINGVSVPFASGTTLASNWNSAATIAAGITSDDNLCQPYANASGNVFVSVLDNSNNNAAGGNPSTGEQTSGVSVAFLPYSGGWTGASVNSAGTVTSGNLPSGVTISKSGGVYYVDGLSVAGNLLAFTNGDSGTLADNVCSVRIVSGRWGIDTRDNAGTAQDNDFNFVYFPPNTTGVYAGKVSAAGVVSNTNTSATALGVTAVTAANGVTLTFGDGSAINPATTAFFAVGDSSNGAASSTAADNLISWSANGSGFRVFTQDLPENNGSNEAIDLRFVAIPLVALPSVTTGTLAAITASGATIAGNNVTSDGGAAITERGVAFASTPNPTTATGKVTVVGTTGSFDATLTGLASGAAYYARAFATNAAGTVYGTEITLTTSGLGVDGTITALGAIYGSPSAPASIAVRGTSLTGDVTVTAPTGFEVSLAETTGYAASVVITASGNLATTPIYVRLVASSAPGTYSGDLSISGGDAPTVTAPIPASTVVPKSLTLADAAVTTKTYDGATSAVITGNLTGVIAPDLVGFTGGGSFATANAGTNISVTAALTLTGADAAKYSFTQPVGLTGTIEKASQTVSFAPLAARTYGDGAFDLTGSATSSLGLSFTSTNAGVVSISGSTVTLVGAGTATIRAAQAGNGNFQAADAVEQTLTVAAKALTLESAAVTDKLYDGTTAATITGTLTGVIGTDEVTFTGTGTFATAGPGTAIPVTAAITLGGAQAGNYSVTQPQGLTGNISSSFISFAADVYRPGQADSSVTLTLTRSSNGAAATATLRTDNGTASTVPAFSAALAGTDYTDIDGTVVSFAAGETTKTVTVTLTPKTAATTPNRRFSVAIQSVTGGSTGDLASATVEILASDTIKPTLAITAPATAGATVSDLSPYTVRGTAGDNRGLDRVTVSLNGAAAVEATLSAATVPTSVPWSIEIEPVAGANSLEVIAYDLRGNSTTLSRSFTYTERHTLSVARTAPAPVAVETAGTVTLVAAPAAQASVLTPTTANVTPQTAKIVPGTLVTLTATPKIGFAFTEWSSLPAGATAVGNIATFPMPAADLMVSAAFQTGDVFSGPAGSGNAFQGLLLPATGVATNNASVGFLTGTLATTGVFSGRLLIDGLSQTFTATFYGDGSSSFTVNGAKQDAFAFGTRSLTLSYNAASGKDAIQATLESGGSPVSSGTARRSIYSATNTVAAALLNVALPASGPVNRGTFTVAFPAKTQDPVRDAATYPQGDGYATLTLTNAGAVTGTGFLSDGTSFSIASALVSGNQCPIFAQLPTPGQVATARGGSFLGTLTFDTTQADTDVAGTGLTWIRPDVTELTAGTTPAAIAAANLYTAGWPVGIQVDAIGALYDKALTVQAGIDLDGSSLDVNGNTLGYEDGKLVLSAGKLSPGITKQNFIVAGNTVTKLPLTDATFTLAPSAVAGTFTGTFRPNWTPLATTNPAFKGILIQKGANKGGHGFFLSNATADANPEAGDVDFTLEPLSGAIAPVVFSTPASVSAAAPYTISGTAGNPRGLARVEVAVNGGTPVNAVLGTAAAGAVVPYNLAITPELGTNTVVITAVDLRGNRTSTTLTFTFLQRFLLTLNRAVPSGVSVDAAGTVALGASPATQATALTPTTANANPRTALIQHGTAVTLTATPKAGYAFVRWIGLPVGATVTGNVATFAMPTAPLEVTAEFASASSLFAGAAGSGTAFYGLIRPEEVSATSNATVGFLTGTINASTGLFTGSILMDGLTQAVSTTFYGDGSAVFVSGTSRRNSLIFGGKTLALSLNTGGGSDEISVTVTTGTGTSSGIARRAPYSASSPVPVGLLNTTTGAINSGFATVVFPSKAQTLALSASSYPQGDGFATVTISNAGVVTLSGTLADNTTFTATSGLVEGNVTPFFAQILTPGSLTARGGSFSGTLTFDPNQSDSDLTGADLLWIRPAVTEVTGLTAAALATQLYSGGWPSGLRVDALGALYNKAATAQTSLGLGAINPVSGNAKLEAADSKLTATITKTNVNVNGNTVTKIPATDTSFTLTVTPATGAFSGTLRPNWTPAATALPTFRGIILQKGINQGGFGFFLSNIPADQDPESGGVSLGKP